MKRVISFLLAFIMLFGLVGCSGNNAPANNASEDTAIGGEDSEVPWKIGIMTGTVSQNEEEYRAAEKVLEEYGAEHVVLKTYPDKFMDEQDTTISNIVELASDPDIKAIIIVQGVPGVSAGIQKAKEIRDDILFMVGIPGEDPSMIASNADIVLAMDELSMGTTIPEQAKAMGAKTLVHYSFPRHMSYALLAARRDLLREHCKEVGIDFVDATAPDPTSDAGLTGAQQFILEDVPRMVAKYGKDTAFFSTNCGMQVPLIKSTVDTGAIYPQPCCPSPTHGFPAALALEIPKDKQADMDFIIQQITDKTEELGMSGRLSTWPVPCSMMFVEAGAKYAKGWITGEFEEKLNQEKLMEYFEAYAKKDIKVQTLVDKDKDGNEVEYPNYLMFLLDYYTF